MKRRIILALLASLLAATSMVGADKPDVRLETNRLILREGDPPAVVNVRRGDVEAASAFTVTYRWRLEGFYYFNGPSGSGTLTFGVGDKSTKTVTIPIPNDNAYSYHGNFPSGSIAIYDSSDRLITFADIVVLDDDPPPTLTGPGSITVAEGNSGTTDVMVHYKLSATFGNQVAYDRSITGGTATIESDFTGPQFAPGPGGPTDFYLLVKVRGDTTPEIDETLVVTLWIGPLRADATIVILNDEYLVTPLLQQIERGQSGAIFLSTSVPSPSSEHVELSSSAPEVASVPPFIDIPAGATTATIPITGASAGYADITVRLPASRGGVNVTGEVTVFEPSALTFDRPAIAISLGTITTAKAQLTPLPPSPFSLAITNSHPAVAEVPPSFTIGIDGKGSFPVRAIGTGASTVGVTLPPQHGGGTSRFRVDVSQPTGLAITGLSAKSGPATGNQLITLFGNNIKGRCTVTFGGVSALSTAVAANGSVTTYTPPHSAGVVHVGIRCGTEEFQFANAYTYTAAAPRITRIAPATGAASGGTIVTASGENLPRGRCGLWFGGSPATTLINLQATEMSAIAPPHAAGVAGVSLRCGADVSTLNDAFVYTGDEPPAEIAAVNPPSAAPGERVLIGGSRFQTGDRIAFGGAAALDMTSTAGEHFVTVPEIPAGPATVTLRDTSGRTITGPSFTVKPPAVPQIASAPAKVTAGSELVVNGSGFRPSLSFLLAGIALRTVVVAPTYAVLRVPAAMQPQTTTLAVTGGPSRAIEVIATGVAVESASPPCVSTEGGALVTIRGSGFEPGAVVTFGIADGTDVVVKDAHTIIARAPASSGVSDATITVINPSLESGQLTGAFQYRWPDPACGGTRRRPARH